MGLKIVYTKIARLDLSEIYSYIKRDSLRYATIEVKSIRLAIKKLKSNPLIGRKFEKLNDELTRELIFKNYRIIYEIFRDKQIVILSIHHHSRLISNNPAFKDDE